MKKYPPTFQIFCSYTKRTQYKLLETLFWVFYLHPRACQRVLVLTLFTILKFSYTENLNLICLQFYHKVPVLGLCSNINDRKPRRAGVWAMGSFLCHAGPEVICLRSAEQRHQSLTACPLSSHYTALNQPHGPESSSNCSPVTGDKKGWEAPLLEVAKATVCCMTFARTSPAATVPSEALTLCSSLQVFTEIPGLKLGSRHWGQTELSFTSHKATW